jgi:flagellar hook-associated protein 3 FlgL
MRVTSRSLQDAFLNNLSDVKKRLQEKQTEIAIGKKITKPSDNPFGTARLMRLNSQIEDIDTYLTNIDNGMSNVEMTTSVMEQIQQQVADLVADLSNSLDATENKEDYAKKVDLALENLLSLANYKFNDKYIFGGTNQSEAPYGWNAAGTGIEEKTTALDGYQKIRISNTVTQKINEPGRDLFGTVTPGGNDVFNLLISIKDKLDAGENVDASDIKALDDINTHMISEVTKMGNYYKRMEDSQTLLENLRLNVESLMSKEQEVDMARAIMDMENYQASLDRTLKISAQILPKSLLDYL